MKNDTEHHKVKFSETFKDTPRLSWVAKNYWVFKLLNRTWGKLDEMEKCINITLNTLTDIYILNISLIIFYVI